jgi:hypothetical protein
MAVSLGVVSSESSSAWEAVKIDPEQISDFDYVRNYSFL